MSNSEVLICADECMHSAETISPLLPFPADVIHVSQKRGGGADDSVVVTWAMAHLNLNGHKICFIVTYDRKFERHAKSGLEKVKERFPDKEIRVIVVRDKRRRVEKVIEALKNAYEEWQRNK